MNLRCVKFRLIQIYYKFVLNFTKQTGKNIVILTIASYKKTRYIQLLDNHNEIDREKR